MARHADSLALVWKFAESEARYLGAGAIEPVHFFLGLLKAVDIDFSQLKGFQDKREKKISEITKDLADVRLAFERADIETTPVRRELRRRLGRGNDKRNVHLRRSSRARTVFKVSEAFVKNGEVKPVHLLSILVEANLPSIVRLLQDSGLDSELLREASTKIAISGSTAGKISTEKTPAARWERIFDNLKNQGWSLGWSRSIRNDILFWNVEAIRGGIRHVVRSEDITGVLVELERAILG